MSEYLLVAVVLVLVFVAAFAAGLWGRAVRLARQLNQARATAVALYRLNMEMCHEAGAVIDQVAAQRDNALARVADLEQAAEHWRRAATDWHADFLRVSEKLNQTEEKVP